MLQYTVLAIVQAHNSKRYITRKVKQMDNADNVSITVMTDGKHGLLLAKVHCELTWLLRVELATEELVCDEVRNEKYIDTLVNLRKGITAKSLLRETNKLLRNKREEFERTGAIRIVKRVPRTMVVSEINK